VAYRGDLLISINTLYHINFQNNLLSLNLNAQIKENFPSLVWRRTTWYGYIIMLNALGSSKSTIQENKTNLIWNIDPVVRRSRRENRIRPFGRSRARPSLLADLLLPFDFVGPEKAAPIFTVWRSKKAAPFLTFWSEHFNLFFSGRFKHLFLSGWFEQVGLFFTGWSELVDLFFTGWSDLDFLFSGGSDFDFANVTFPVQDGGRAFGSR